jgi:hypothetical protein
MCGQTDTQGIANMHTFATFHSECEKKRIKIINNYPYEYKVIQNARGCCDGILLPTSVFEKNNGTQEQVHSVTI